jgi:2-dehydro-3-deoxyphosphogluconate aldolase/(4S)-4-hydroxy-2-oxoglutarate aldolase
MSHVFDVVERARLVPVVKIDDAADAAPLAKALLAGGLPIAEITFRTAAAAAAIAAVSKEVPEVLVGAGTVLTVDQVKSAVDAGARFIVAPGFNPKVVSHCISHDIPVLPGINSPTQVEMALDFGLNILKFFPAEPSGGIKMLSALAGPYVGVRYVPTGGVGPENLISYLKLKCVVACGGSWMVKSDLISAGKFDDISRLTREAVDLAGTATGA